MVRADGSESRKGFHKVEARVTLPDDYESATFDEIISRLDDCASEVARQQTEYALQVIQQAIDEGGYVQRAKVRLSPDVLLGALEHIGMEFDRTGNPVRPTLFVHPSRQHAVEGILRLLDTDPTLKRRMDEIVRAKREEWRDREINRRLVG